MPLKFQGYMPLDRQHAPASGEVTLHHFDLNRSPELKLAIDGR